MTVEKSIDSAFGKTLRSSKDSHCSIFSETKKTGLSSGSSQLRMRESERDGIPEIMTTVFALMSSVRDFKLGY